MCVGGWGGGAMIVTIATHLKLFPKATVLVGVHHAHMYEELCYRDGLPCKGPWVQRGDVT